MRLFPRLQSSYPMLSSDCIQKLCFGYILGAFICDNYVAPENSNAKTNKFNDCDKLKSDCAHAMINGAYDGVNSVPVPSLIVSPLKLCK